MVSGLILFNKKPCITSFDALREIKRALGTGKVGHTGTLDKFAGGLLIVLVGKALRLSQWFTHCDKKYEGRICFGAETDTLDPEGCVIAEAAVPSREDVERVLSQFTGSILQAPPAYSAIHVDGKRAASLARAGAPPEMKKREVNVYKLELRSWQPPFADIFVHCSSGTYIRSLARDIALAVGSRGYLISLLRTQIAGFMLEEAGNITHNFQTANPRSPLPITKDIISTLGMHWFDVTGNEAKAILQGKSLDSIMKNKNLFPSVSSVSSVPPCPRVNSYQPYAVFCGEALIAVVENADGNWKYICVPGEENVL